MPTEPLLKIDDAARLLNVSARTIARLVTAGDIPSVEIAGNRRFDPSAIRQWLSEGCPTAAERKAREIERTTGMTPLTLKQRKLKKAV